MKIISVIYLVVSGLLFVFSIFQDFTTKKFLFGIITFSVFVCSLVLFIDIFLIKPIKKDAEETYDRHFAQY